MICVQEQVTYLLNKDQNKKESPKLAPIKEPNTDSGVAVESLSKFVWISVNKTYSTWDDNLVATDLNPRFLWLWEIFLIL